MTAIEIGAYFPGRLAVERKRVAIPSLVLAWGGGVTERSVRAQERADGHLNRCVLETMLMSNPDMAEWSTMLLAEHFGVNVITARRARVALENRGLIARTVVRRCRDGCKRNFDRLVGHQWSSRKSVGGEVVRDRGDR